MNKIRYCVYSPIFWISRLISISLFSICLLSVIHAKYVISQKCSIVMCFLIEFLENRIEASTDFLFSTGLYKLISFNAFVDTYVNFCKNSQRIDILLIALAVIFILSIVVVKFIKREHICLLTISVISSVVYLTMYSIFNLPIMLALTISTPVILIIIYFLNRICPTQKVIMLVPIIGEIFCIRAIINYISEKVSDRIINICLLLTALILSNVICFLFPYSTNKDFENRIMNNWTYSIRPYQDKLIISGDRELIIIDNNGIDNHIKNDEFSALQDFIINGNKKEIYFYNADDVLLIVNIEDLNIINKINIVKEDFNCTRIYCNKDCSKIIFVKENGTSGFVNLNIYDDIKYIKNIPEMRDGLIYNKYRDCFLVSFHKKNSFLQEIDIKNKKIRKIKEDKYQGYLAISERNKEIYLAFHQQGRIGVYDAETMKLKRNIKSKYTVKNITYDEELNILIAPSYFAGYVDIFLMDGSDKLIAREFVGYGLREGCFDPQKENLYVCSENGLYKKKIDIKKLIDANYNNK